MDSFEYVSTIIGIKNRIAAYERSVISGPSLAALYGCLKTYLLLHSLIIAGESHIHENDRKDVTTDYIPVEENTCR